MSDPETLKIIRDPSTIKSRIFIGNMPPANVNKKDIEDIFDKYGKITAISINRGFAFVQFDNENSANEAIKSEAGRMLQNKKLDIKHAQRGKNKSPERGGPLGRERSPFDDNRGSMDDRDHDRLLRGGGRGGGRGGRGGIGREKDWREMDRYDPGYGLSRGQRGPPLDDEPYPPTDYPIGGKLVGPYGDPKMGLMPPPAQDVGPVSQVDRTNDCEIIVVNKSITEYAEYIERRLKKVGLTVDLLFPNEDVPLGRVLANISGRGSLYAIIVTLQNEEHRSLTLNILHGQHQEHRNMPMEDALNLMMRNFELYLRGERVGFGASALGPTFDRHPEAIQTLLNLLQQNRQLTVLQYDKIIRYLQEKREMQVKIELGDSKDVPPIAAGPDSGIPPAKQAELQNRILNILKNKTGNSEAAPAPVPAPTSWGGATGGPAASVPGGGPPPLLNDPTVQKALDNLIQGDLLRKLPGAPAPVPPPQPLFGAYGSGRKY